MATTQKGIYYPDDYTAIADVPEDMKDLAESVDTALGDIEDNIEQNIQPQIDDINEEQTIQNNEIEALQTENTRLKATLPTTTGTGENITLQNTAELEFIQPPLPRGNSEQDGEPSPTNEVPITNVTGDVEVLLQNKNLLKYKANNFDSLGGVTGVVDNDGGIILNGTTSVTNFMNISRQDLSGSNYSAVLIGNINNNVSITHEKTGVFIRVSSGVTLTNLKIFPMVTYSSTTATTYTPHKEQTYTFPLGTQRMYLGDYLADDGIHHVRKQVTLDGISDGLKFTGAEPNRNNRFSLGKSGIKEQTYTQNTYMKSSHFSYNVSVFFDAQDQIGFAVNKSIIYVRFGSSSEINTITKANNWLASNLPALEYELAEEEITPYTIEQQQAYNEIKQALSYNEQTNISGSSDESNPLFSVEAYQSIKLVLEEISNAVVALGGV